MNTVLITGSAGFLGSHIARHFSDLGWQVWGVDLPPAPSVAIDGMHYQQMSLPSAAFGELLDEVSPDVCVHCAGRASVPLSMEDPRTDFFDNTALTFEVLDALRTKAPKCKFILLSSAAVYGNPSALPVSENQHLAPLSPYGFHKRQCELLCQEFARVYQVPAVSMRIFSAYGPRLQRQVMWDICEKLLKTGSLTLKGTGRESRDFIHGSDIARAVALLADKAPAQGEIYNVSTGRETSIAELAQLCASALGQSTTAIFDGTVRIGDPLHWHADVSKLSALGFAPLVNLERGVEEVAQWARQQLSKT